MDVETLYKLIEKEGDYKEFEYKGFQCMIHRVPMMKHLCGYVEVTPMMEIPLEIVLENIHSHGGITYKGEMSDKEGFWIGFHCGHFTDIIPEVFKDISHIRHNWEYRDMEYVESILMVMVEEMLFLRRKLLNELRS